jgi:hypothetical protein
MNFGGGFKTDSGMLSVHHIGLAICMIKEGHTTAFGNFQWGLTCKSWRFMNKKTLSEYYFERVLYFTDK